MSSLYYVGLCFCRSIYINLRQFCSSTIYMVVHKLLNLQQYTTFKNCIAKISSFTHTLNTQHTLGFEETAVSNQITTNFVIGLRSQMEVVAASKSGLSYYYNQQSIIHGLISAANTNSYNIHIMHMKNICRQTSCI